MSSRIGGHAGFWFLQDADQKKAVYYALHGTAIALIANAIDFRISHPNARLRLWIVTSSPFRARDLHAYVLKIYIFPIAFIRNRHTIKTMCEYDGMMN